MVSEIGSILSGIIFFHKFLDKLFSRGILFAMITRREMILKEDISMREQM